MALARSMVPRFARAGVALAAVCLWPGVAAAQNWGRPLDQGGDIAIRLRQISASAGQRHEISGDCKSACTLWLGHKGACVDRDAVLWFHAAADGLKQAHFENPWLWTSAAGNRLLLSAYPARVRALVAGNGWLDTPEMHTLTGAQLIALGVTACR